MTGSSGCRRRRSEGLTGRVFFAAFALACMGLLCVTAQAQNKAQAASASASDSGQRTDGQIEMDVVAALDASAALKNDLITAATVQGEVTLAGTVSSAASRDLAGSIAGHVSGVTKVNNKLLVGNPQQAAIEGLAGNESSQSPEETNQPETSPPANQVNQPATPLADVDEPAQTQAPAYRQPYSQPAPSPNQSSAQAAPAHPNESQSYPNQPQTYPNQPQYGYPQQQYPSQQQQPYPNQRQYGYAQPRRTPSYEYATAPVTLPEGTLLQLRTSEALSSKKAAEGTPVQFTVIQDVTLGGVLAIPRGATVHGVVTESKATKSGDLGGSSSLALQLTSLDLGGKTYPLNSDEFKVKGPNKAGQTVGSAVAGGLLGTIIGCAAGRGAGCAIGAGAGAAAGTAAGAAAPGPNVWIPAEALVTFHLKTPVSVDPVSAEEAQRLAQGLYQGGPSLYRRGYGGYGAYGAPYAPYGAPYAAYPYGYYPPVYYRPYYLVGGYYYWR